MDEQEILAAMAELGIEPEMWRLVLMLPLVQVAWADDAVQDAERARILAIAQHAGLVDGQAARMLEGWLTIRPLPEDLALGRRILVALAHRQRGLGAEMDAGELDRVLALCLDVARSAGGLFGAMFSVSRAERAAIAEISAGLKGAADAFLDGLPEPATGRYEDL